MLDYRALSKPDFKVVIILPEMWVGQVLVKVCGGKNVAVAGD